MKQENQKRGFQCCLSSNIAGITLFYIQQFQLNGRDLKPGDNADIRWLSQLRGWPPISDDSVDCMDDPVRYQTISDDIRWQCQLHGWPRPISDDIRWYQMTVSIAWMTPSDVWMSNSFTSPVPDPLFTATLSLQTIAMLMLIDWLIDDWLIDDWLSLLLETCRCRRDCATCWGFPLRQSQGFQNPRESSPETIVHNPWGLYIFKDHSERKLTAFPATMWRSNTSRSDSGSWKTHLKSDWLEDNFYISWKGGLGFLLLQNV